MYSLSVLTIFRRDIWTSRFRAAHFLAMLVLMFASAGAVAMERVDALTLEQGANLAKSVFTSNDGHWAWVVCQSADPPNDLVKIDLTTFEEAGVVDFAAPGDWAAGPISAIDPFGSSIYVAYTQDDFQLTIAKVDINSMQRLSEGPLGYAPTSLVVDALGDYAYMGTDEGIVDKIDLATMQVVDEIDTGTPFLRSSAIDRGSNTLYLGADLIPGTVVKVDLNTFQVVGTLAFQTGESSFRSIVIDPNGTAAYLGTYNTVFAQIAKVDLATFEPAGTLIAGSNVIGLGSATIDRTGTYAYFGSVTFPPRIVKVDLAAFQLVDELMLDETDNSIMGTALGSDGATLYAGLYGTPGRVVKVTTESPAQNLLRFDPTGLDFHNVEIGTTGTSTATLTNAGTNAVSALNFSSTLPDGISIDTSACGLSLDVGASCTVQLTYTPTIATTLDTQWGVSGAEGATAHVALLGHAVPAHAGAEITPAVLDFGGIDLGSTSAPQTFTLTNTGDVSMMIVAFQRDGDTYDDFDIDSSACQELDPGQSCDVDVQFHPRGVAPASVSLALTDSSVSASIALAGYGVQSADALMPDPTSIDFGLDGVGEMIFRLLTLHNRGYDVVRNVQITSSDPAFTVDASLCTQLSPNSICDAEVFFTPEAAGDYAGTLTVTTDEGVTFEVPVSGTATGTGGTPTLLFDPQDLDFGSIGMGTEADPRWITVSNGGNGTANITSVEAMAPFEVESTDCVTLEPGNTCTVRLSYAPQQIGKDLGSLNVTYDIGTASMLVSGSGSTDAIFQGGFD